MRRPPLSTSRTVQARRSDRSRSSRATRYLALAQPGRLSPTVRLSVAVALLAAAILDACAGYEPKPLPERPDFKSSVLDLAADSSRISLPDSARYRFDLSDGLDMTAVATLAVVNNPDLKLARDRAGVAGAEAFAAGLLPDPQLSLARDFPLDPSPALASAYNLGLSYDLSALVGHAAGRRAAEARAHQANLDLLWQEWQVVAQARLLFVQATTEEQLVKLLHVEKELFQERADRAQAALAAGNLAIGEVSAYLSAVQGTDKQINDLERQASGTRYDLNALLGFAPQVHLDLIGSARLTPLDRAAALAALPELPHRRPDLLALQAGYRAQEERLRQAVLAQFPALNVGFTRARDNTNINSRGFAVTITLPIFNRGRGAVATQTATRQRLYDEYQIRLNATYSDVHRILDNETLLQAQREALDANLARLHMLVARADAAYRSKAIDVLQYVNFRAALIASEIEDANLQSAQLGQRIALATLVGGELSVQQSEIPQR